MGKVLKFRWDHIWWVHPVLKKTTKGLITKCYLMYRIMYASTLSNLDFDFALTNWEYQAKSVTISSQHSLNANVRRSTAYACSTVFFEIMLTNKKTNESEQLCQVELLNINDENICHLTISVAHPSPVQTCHFWVCAESWKPILHHKCYHT